MALEDLFYRSCRGDKDVEIPIDVGFDYERTIELEELNQNGALSAAILAGVEELTERDVASLRGLWRGRSKAQKETEETRARMNQ